MIETLATSSAGSCFCELCSDTWNNTQGMERLGNVSRRVGLLGIVGVVGKGICRETETM